MKITFLGGGHEIGASSTLLTCGDTSLLFDCGVKYTSSGGMPSFSLLQDSPPRAIILTHAHMDHSGTLPILMDSLPDIPLYMTPPTLDLITILMKDSLKIMGSASEREGEIPLYSEKSVNNMLARAVTMDFGVPFSPCGSETAVTFYPAGHILGAAMAVVESSEGSVVVTGDYSVQDQAMVPGLKRPPGRRRVVISESTYGNRMHTDRRLEERRLIRQVCEKVTDGGKVLIPAFALGRAQEIIFLLARAMASGEIPEFPIWVDGMVRQVCEAYTRHPSCLNPEPSDLLARGVDPFTGLTPAVRMVKSPEQRREIVRGPACCIIASSGMMTGGPSLYYGRELARDPGNLIAITGYQDEESPGHWLLKAAAPGSSGGRRGISLSNGFEGVQVKCSIDSYSLSAHADQTEMSALISAFKPSDVILAHGDDQARNALADLLSDGRVGRVHLPQNGDTLELQFRTLGKAGSRAVPRPDTKASCPSTKTPTLPDLAQVRAIWDELHSRQRASAISAHQLWSIWLCHRDGRDCHHDLLASGAMAQGHSAHIQQFSQILVDSGLFRRDRKYAFLLRPRAQAQGAGHHILPGQGNPQAVPMELVNRMLPPELKVMRKGFDKAARQIVLTLAFPLAAGSLVREIDAVLQASGWSLRINGGTNLGELKTALAKVLEENGGQAPGPDTKVSIQNEQALVVLKSEDPPSREILRQAALRFRELTGFDLEAERIRRPRHPAGRDLLGRMEINAAYALADRIFTDSACPPYKKSRKRDADGEYMELAFITPEMGHQQNQLIERLTRESGWPVKVSPSPNQDALKNLARELTAQEMELKREPSFLGARKMVKVRVASLPDQGLAKRLAMEFRRATGFDLEFSL